MAISRLGYERDLSHGEIVYKHNCTVCIAHWYLPHLAHMCLHSFLPYLANMHRYLVFSSGKSRLFKYYCIIAEKETCHIRQWNWQEDRKRPKAKYHHVDKIYIANNMTRPLAPPAHDIHVVWHAYCMTSRSHDTPLIWHAGPMARMGIAWRDPRVE